MSLLSRVGRPTTLNISFIGGGVMAEAILRGILSKGIAAPQEVCVGEPVEARRRYLSQAHGVKTTAENKEAARRGDMVIFSIKPQSLPEVSLELAGSLRKDQTALSIIAGATMRTLTNGLGHQAVIRVMPNTPAQIGAGMSLWIAAEPVPADARQTAAAILRTLGEEKEVHEEKYLDMATALSGSGPAYVFLFIESLIDAGVYMGMSRDMARAVAVQTVLGSTRLVQETGKHPAELRDMVTSPGGTTAEALRALEEGGFRATVLRAVVAAYEKSKRLGEQT
ncbi:MAG: pyrroline-5-carboxylate reductase [Chloroflexi bacterium]|nr:pyrroline-5-carboxylate reductase [Chloroflexota bacterium]